jgi:hypothetical protein
MTHDEMKAAVLDHIRQRRSVSYAELEWLFDQKGYPWKGNLDCCSTVNTNVVIWSGWCADAYNILQELMIAGQIHREPAGPMVYLLDGKTLTLPRVKQSCEYKTPHWAPAVFEPGAATD